MSTDDPESLTDSGADKLEEAAHAGSMPLIPSYTVTLLVCLGAVFVTQFLTSNEEFFAMLDRPSADRAGFDKVAFVEERQYWRILTGTTIHSGMLHFLMNSYALFSFGRIFEFLTNRAHLAIVFLLAAISGGLLSLAFMPHGISVGASGGIVGLIGYLAVYTFKRHQFISPEFRRGLLMNIGFIILFGLVLYQVVDNYGHIGGLLCGAVYGLIQIPRDPYTNPAIAGRFVQWAGLISLGIFVVGSLFSILLLIRPSWV